MSSFTLKALWQKEKHSSPSNSNSTCNSSIQERNSFDGEYSERAARLVALVNQLRDVGAQIDIDLPSIVICGNQSVGKSSILEAISGIPFPRGQGTITRCVTEVRLITGSDQDWSCNIKLRRESQNTIQEIDFLKRHTPTGLDKYILLAQKALLNPSKQSSFYSNPTENVKLESENELLFTSNVVCLEIIGAKVDLTLIDLPGIIHSVSTNQDKNMISLVNDLVKSYISNPRCIILAAISCKDDIENQAIFHLAREADELGNRTIGVLTKPDTIEPGTHDKWLDVLLGKRYQLKLGYFMVKLPSILQIEDAQGGSDFIYKQEDGFFSSTKPWSALKEKTDRLGIYNLRIELSSVLSTVIDSSLPDMKSSVETALHQINQVLDSLPPALENDGKIELLQNVRHFSTLVNYHINAQQNLKVFNQKIRRHFEYFRDSILATRPKLVTEKSPDSSTNGSPSSGFWKRSESTPSPKPAITESTNYLTLEDLRAIVNGQKGRELEGYSSYGAFEHLVKRFQQDWKSHASILLSNVSNELSSLLAKLSDDSFGRFFNLKSQIRVVIQVFQSDLQRITHGHLMNTLAMESRLPFTLNSQKFLRQKLDLMDTLLLQFPDHSTLINQPSGYPVTNKEESMKRALKALSDLGLRNLTPQSILSRLSTPLSTSDTVLLDLISSAMSYFDISSGRVIDNICQQIDYHYLFHFGDLLEKELVHSIGILDKSSQEINDLLREDLGMVERRRLFTLRKERLEKVWKSIHEFGFY